MMKLDLHSEARTLTTPIDLDRRKAKKRKRLSFPELHARLLGAERGVVTTLPYEGELR